MNTQAMLGMIQLSGVGLLLIALSLTLTAFWIWMLVDCAMRVSKDSKKVGWLIAIGLTYGFGALIYFFFGRRAQETGHAPVA
jgi:hypothetical protein